MRPGAIERWRVLNGSVDGRGFVRVMVLRGELELCENGQIGRSDASGVCTPLDTVEIEALKMPLHQLAMDGVTLVRETEHGGYEYFIKNLNVSAPPNPLDLSANDTAEERVRKIAACYANSGSIRAAYNRPNEVILAPANRTDLFFRAPDLAVGSGTEVFTVVAQFDILHNENYEKGLRQRVAQGDNSLPNWPGDTVLSLVVVKGEPVDGGPIDMKVLAPVPSYLQPVTDDEVQIDTEQEAAARGTRVGAYRTRTITYSGWGNADFPVLDVSREALIQRPDLLNLTYGPLMPGGEQLVGNRSDPLLEKSSA